MRLRQNARMDRRHVALAGHTGDVATALTGLTDTEPAVRATALAALDRLGALPEGAIADGLNDPSPVVRRRAAELASRHPSVDVLATLADPEPLVAEAAAFALGEHPPSERAVATLSDVVRDHADPLVREAAVAALGSLGVRGGLPAILHATRDKPAIRRRAVLALAPFEGPEVDEALQAALEDRDWQVRQAAEDLLA